MKNSMRNFQGQGRRKRFLIVLIAHLCGSLLAHAHAQNPGACLLRYNCGHALPIGGGGVTPGIGRLKADVGRRDIHPRSGFAVQADFKLQLRAFALNFFF